MPREVVLLLLSFTCSAAIWPPALDAYQRGVATPIEVSGAEAAVWKEYGLQEAERAEYQRAGRSTKLIVEAWRLADSTSAVAASQWVRGLAGPGVTVHAQGNYVVTVGAGYRPAAKELAAWTERLAAYKYGPAPTLPSYLPREGRLAGRDRYILGPASLEAFLPAVSAQAAGFEPFQTEAQVAEYGEVRLAVFRFPTPAIAKGQMGEFQKLGGAKIKRSGPLVALAMGKSGAAANAAAEAAAEKLLGAVAFDVIYSYTDTTPTQMPNVAEMILAIFELAGVVILVGFGGGLLVAAWLIFARRSREAQENPSMTTLKLGR